MCRNSFSETRVSCFWLAYPLWNGSHYRKLPTRGFNKELLCGQRGPGYWGWAKRTWSFCSWSFDLSAGLAGPASGQTVSGDQWPRVTGTEAHQLFSALVRWCVPSLGGVVPHCCCMSKTLTKSKGLHFVWDDIECCKGEKPVFCSCCSETLLQFYT